MIRVALRWILAAFYALAGWAHIADPAPFLTIMPDAVPAPEAVVFWTGIAEIAGAIALVQPWYHDLRRWGGIGLALYAPKDSRLAGDGGGAMLARVRGAIAGNDDNNRAIGAPTKPEGFFGRLFNPQDLP